MRTRINRYADDADERGFYKAESLCSSGLITRRKLYVDIKRTTNPNLQTQRIINPLERRLFFGNTTYRTLIIFLSCAYASISYSHFHNVCSVTITPIN